MGITDKKIHRYRMDGMAYALKIVEQGGVEALRQEVKTRAAAFFGRENGSAKKQSYVFSHSFS